MVDVTHNLTEVQKQSYVNWYKKCLKKFQILCTRLLLVTTLGFILTSQKENKKSTVWVFQHGSKWDI